MKSSTPPEVHHGQKCSLQQRFPLQTLFHRLRSSSPLSAAMPTTLPSSTWVDEPEDYTVPEERSQSFVFAYVIHQLLLPATLSFKLEFWIAHGSHIEPATNSMCIQSGSSRVFYVVHVGWATNNRWSIVYIFKTKAIIYLLSLVLDPSTRLLPPVLISACTP